jgi:hypothetical protein
LEFMGLGRYYNKLNKDRGYIFIPKNLENYRLGLHKPGDKQDIKIIKH